MKTQIKLLRTSGLGLFWFAVVIFIHSGICDRTVLAKLGRPKAPVLKVSRLSGETVVLGEPTSSGRLVVFVKSWCEKSQALLTDILSVIEYFPAEDLEVVVIAAGEGCDKAAILTEVLPERCVYADPTGINAVRYRIKYVPQAFFVSQDGRFRPVKQVTIERVWGLLAGDDPFALEPDPVFLKNFTGKSDPNNRLRRVIVKLDGISSLSPSPAPEGRPQQAMRDLLAKRAVKMGARVIHDYGKLKNRMVVEIDEDKLEVLRSLPGFRGLSEDRPVKALLEDSAYQIHADYAWNNAITGEGIKVAVVDTGIDTSHPDLRNKVIAQYNAQEDSDNAEDDNGHGTHVAGIIASQGVPYRGISYDVALMGVKVLDSGGAGFSSDVIAGIEWAVAHGADVINLSLGEGLYSTTCDETEMGQAVNSAVDAGVVVVCASGNDGNPSQIVAPACASKVIAVGSVDKVDNVASYSDGGAELDLVAPGGDTFGGSQFAEIVAPFSTIVANDPFLCLYMVQDQCYDDYFTVDNKRYIRAVGTSMAAPHAAGAAALLLEANGDLSPEQVKQVLEESADDLGDPGWDPIYGWGRVNLEKALDTLPGSQAELSVRVTEPNRPAAYSVNSQFNLGAQVDCRGGNGCGEVSMVAEYAESGSDTFTAMGPAGQLATSDPNPIELGSLSPATVDINVGLAFDAVTDYDPSAGSIQATLSPETAAAGSLDQGQYYTGDLEPDDALGAIGEDVSKVYAFSLPAGVIKKLSVRMEHYLVIQSDGAYNGWEVYLADSEGTAGPLLGDCIVPEGGGGLEQPPDCWWISEDPATLAALNAGGMNYLLLQSHDVGADDWLTFNDIEVTADYQSDPSQDNTYRYLCSFDLSGVDPNSTVTAARLQYTIQTPAEQGVGEVYLVDNQLTESSSAADLYEPAGASYSNLGNPIKTFAADQAGAVKLNIKSAVEEALGTGQDRLTFQLREQNSDALLRVMGGGSPLGPQLIVSQLNQESGTTAGGSGEPGAKNPPALPAVYDSQIDRQILSDQYSKSDAPAEVLIGAPFIMEYNTGDLETESGVGAIGEDVAKLYPFELPAGTLSEVKVRMRHYLVLHTSNINSGWSLYISDPNSQEHYLIDRCVPIEGGGGEAPPPDCWFNLTDPAGLALLNPGGVNFLKLASDNVGADDWLTFDSLEVIATYALTAGSDTVHRYYLKFDLTGVPQDIQLDAARLNLFVTEAGNQSAGELHLVNPTYDSSTGALSLYQAEDSIYSRLANPYKIFDVSGTGLYRQNVKPAVQDALESGVGAIAFLLTEQEENGLFGISGSSGTQPPELELFVNSGVTTAAGQWGVLPSQEGRYRIRVRANGSIGVESQSPTVTVDVVNPWTPYITSIDCLAQGQWQDCSTLGYGAVIEAIRAAAGDPQEEPQVNIAVSNPDRECPGGNGACQTVLEGAATGSQGQFTLEGPVNLDHSGRWQIKATAADSNGNQTEEQVSWTVPWGRLESRLIDPNSDFSLAKGSGRILTSEVSCFEGDCPNIITRAILNDTVTLAYDDGSEEDYGTIGATEGYLAVKFTPTRYPSQLKSVRVFVYDETAYPFYLHVWDDKGPNGEPGTEMMSPLYVKPVVSSSQIVGWYDVDLSDQQILLSEGSFFIGFSHISDTQLNAVGFDTNGTRYLRSWGYLDLGFTGMWFQLNDYCALEPGYCGNLMIRAVMGEPAEYSGLLPQEADGSPFYVTSGEPLSLRAGETEQVELPLYATGYPAANNRLTILQSNPYQAAKSEPVKVELTAPNNSTEAANLDASGPVNLKDIQLLGQQWLTSGERLSSDINLDGRVGIPDLVWMVEQWLNSGP